MTQDRGWESEHVTETVVETRNLAKSYGSVQALRGGNMDVRRGEIFGFLAPNGDGNDCAAG